MNDFAANPEQNIITVRDVVKTYHLGEVDVPALRGVSLEIKCGDFLVITGRNGSGKSTLLHLLELVGLAGLGDHQPNQLSGGEQQKVAIARSLINDPVVLFADEPTANLDSTAAEEVMSLFQKLNREDGRTVVMITHEQEESHLGNRLVRLADGVVVGEE
jgi:ABC-type lipoprotein export system ATPase subunit